MNTKLLGVNVIFKKRWNTAQPTLLGFLVYPVVIIELLEYEL